MRRLLQIGTILLLLVSFAVPVAEYLDRWDPPGLANDSEFAVFALVLGLCLLLVVCRLVASAVLLTRLLAWWRNPDPGQDAVIRASRLTLKFFIERLLSGSRPRLWADDGTRLDRYRNGTLAVAGQ